MREDTRGKAWIKEEKRKLQGRAGRWPADMSVLHGASFQEKDELSAYLIHLSI